MHLLIYINIYECIYINKYIVNKPWIKCPAIENEMFIGRNIPYV